MSTLHLLPLHFVHILDKNSTITRVELGPKTLVLQTHEELAIGPLPFIIIPPGSYCVIKNPCIKYTPGELPQLRHGYREVHFHKEPFPLYPGEILLGAEQFAQGGKDYKPAVKALPIVKANSALRLRALLDHKDGDIERQAGDMWQVEGPCTYKPVAEAEMMGFIDPVIIHSNEALHLRATQGFVDKGGIERVTGEEWLVKKEGAYVLGVYEELVKVEKPHVLTQDLALHLKATQSLTDTFGKQRLAGEEWLVTDADTETFIPQIGVEVTKQVKKTVLRKAEYCVVMDPVDANGRQQLGSKELRTGVLNFFLHPGERLQKGLQAADILAADEAIVLQAIEDFTDTSGEETVERHSGDRWMITGPAEYIPPVQVKIMQRRSAIPLSKNEGTYVRDTQSGAVRAVMGPQSYMLTAYEVLWEKELPEIVEVMLAQGGGYGTGDIRKLAYFEQSIDPHMIRKEGRDKARVITYRCPGNTACQVYNYKHKTTRTIFGPDLVILGPHEDFNVLSLSAGKPKKADALKSLCLMLGPDFITDILEVETSDHARLQIKIAFNNHFEVDMNDSTSKDSIFSVPDFIGFACRQIGSRIRASVAMISFDEFHRHSAKVIQHAVFGKDAEGNSRTLLKFEANNLVITSIDIQSIEPVDLRMRDSLMKSVQMAIEIATNSIEAAASHEAKRIEQAAKGQLERQKLSDQKEAEKEWTKLYELQAVTAAVESTGQAQAEAQAHAEKIIIECQSEIEGARLKAEAAEIEHTAELEAKQALRKSELDFVRQQNNLEVSKTKAFADMEVDKFDKMVKTIGPGTIAAIASAGPETQVKLLQGLGLESMLITDGKNPINLFNVAQGMVAQPQNTTARI